MSFLSDIFGGGSDAPPPPPPMTTPVPNYGPLVSSAQGISNSALGQSSNYNNTAGTIYGQYPTATAGYNTAQGLLPYNQAQTANANQTSQWAQAYADAASTLQNQQYQWAQSTYAQNQGQIQPIINSFTNTQEQLNGVAANDLTRYQTAFQPLEDSLIKEAKDLGTPERMAANRGRAMAAVAQNYEAQRQNTMRDLESYGINPGSVRYAGLDTGVRTAQAAAEAAAANQSDLATQEQARAAQAQALGIGQADVGQGLAAANLGLGAGTAAVNSALGVTNSGATTMGLPTQYGQLAQGWASPAVSALGVGAQYAGINPSALNSGVGYLNAGTGLYNAGTAAGTLGLGYANLGNTALGTAGNLQNTGFQNSLGQYNANLGQYNAQLKQFDANQQASSGLGSMLGAGAGLLSLGTGGGSTIGAKLLGFAGGGDVPAQASPSAGQATDDVPARLSAGEYVLPRDVVSWLGEEKLQGLINKAREAKQGSTARPQMRQALPGAPTYMSPGAMAMGAGRAPGAMGATRALPMR